ncbi:MAG TPA: DUF4012 domain-containing protein [Candidatus Paceibacterota bacterium]|nr:DUF4012 domain-containing protein [Candidatus Paceibacterota bacterium]
MADEQHHHHDHPEPHDNDIDVRGLAKAIGSEPKHPEGEGELRNIPVTPGNYRRFRGNDEKPLPRGIVWGIVAVAVIFVAGSLISYYVVRGRVMRDVALKAGALAEGVVDLQNFDPQSAEQQFSQLAGGSSDVAGIVNSLGFLFKGSVQAYQSFTSLSGDLTALSGDGIALEQAGSAFVTTGNGSGFVASLEKIRSDLAAIDAASNALATALPSGAASSSFSATLADTYLPMKTQVENAERFLDVFVPWLAAPAPHHVLVLLQNPSEEKPGGGFLGSYADVTVASGSVTAIDVHDIADVDRAFTENIVPPVPLQLETPRFRPADANWFFDFPTSASETVSMFERSGLYAASGTTFDAVVAVSPKVVSDLLALTGPVGVGKPTTTFSSSTLVVQVQKLVQAGQATGATYPKQVLRSLTAAIFGRLAASSSTVDAGTIAGMAADWIAKKDVMMYFKDPTLENFAEQYGATGDVYALPQKFNGDYLAVVNADVNADKSEWYVDQSVTFDAQIGGDGTVSDHVIIDRTHNGDRSPYPWYQTTNQDYLQVFVSPGSSLENENGGIVRTVPAPLNYKKAGYATDPLVASVETSTLTLFAFPAVTVGQQSGKTVFSAWSRVHAGSKTELAFDYDHRLFTAPAPGVEYQFVFEKQAGMRGSYQFEIDAPLGYAFEPSGLPSYTYQSSDPPGRLVVTLTLEKLP